MFPLRLANGFYHHVGGGVAVAMRDDLHVVRIGRVEPAIQLFLRKNRITSVVGRLTRGRMQIWSGEKRRFALRGTVAGDLDPAELEAIAIDADLLLNCRSDIRIDLSLRRAAAMKALDVRSETGPGVDDVNLLLARERLLEERPLRVRDDIDDQFAKRRRLSEQRDRGRKRLPVLRRGDAEACVIELNIEERLQPLLIGLRRQQRKEVEDGLFFHHSGRLARLSVAADKSAFRIGRAADESDFFERQSGG